MARRIKIFIILCIAFTLCGCSNISVSSRAIVKAVYIAQDKGEYQASIIVFNCEPTSQIADVKDNAVVFTSSGETLEKAMSNAEKMQNKQPFYSQNELLFISETAISKFDEIINYFSQEDAARSGASVFITQKTAKELVAAKKHLPKIIKQCENEGQNKYYDVSQKIFEIQLNDNTHSTVLPVLSFGEKEDEFYGVKELVSISDNKLQFALSNEDMLITLLLSNKVSKLKMEDITSSKLSFEADGIYLSFNANKDLTLDITLHGSIRETSNLSTITGDRAKASSNAASINAYLSNACTNIINNFFKYNNDAFKYLWRLEMYSKEKCDILFSSGNFFTDNRVRVLSKLIVL